jgi:hypothetical protein
VLPTPELERGGDTDNAGANHVYGGTQPRHG